MAASGMPDQSDIESTRSTFP
ncbi:MAG: hypothetical protein H6Q04_3019, partial [Acidobacteria bacterium]|nr:hypothetical protein [Acidobacteriota bacterium]